MSPAPRGIAVFSSATGMSETSEYQTRVVRHSKRGARTFLYPGNDYTVLANFFQQRETENASPDSEPFVVAYDLGPTDVTAAIFEPSLNDLDLFARYLRNSSKTAELIFLRGFPSLHWLRVLGATYQIDPALYQRHLQFHTLDDVGSRSYYTTPTLPSFSSNIFQLNIPTIRFDHTVNPRAFPEDIEKERQQASEQLRQYHISLRTKAIPSDSIGRRYSILSRSYSIIDQTASISITKLAGSWNAVIWMDHARDLGRSIRGPWCPTNESRAWMIEMFPIIQHKDRLALRDNLLSQARHQNTTTGWEAIQNACLLPFQYGQGLRKEIMSEDAIYALSEIFQLSAAAEGQILNLLEAQLDREMQVTRTGPPSNASMLNLRYLKSVLDERSSKLAEIALLLENREQLNWPRAIPGSEHRAEADRVASMLLGDFTYLCQRAERLSSNFRESIQSLANSAAYQESFRAVANAERIERLTIVATILLPLSFTCSFFGMNFSLFGQGDLNIWIYFPSATGVMLGCWVLWYLGSRKMEFRQFLRF